MELKKYQKRVIADLRDYLDALNTQPTLTEAFRAFWESRNIPVGQAGVSNYRNVVEGVPHVCYKVPTGGGKTLLACASIKPIFTALPPVRRQAVVWLVPTESILTQTLAALKDPHHPYRQRLNTDFGGRVEVYSKQELLEGQNFNPTSVAEQLSVMVLSYDSFRASRKDGRKAYQANGNLAAFATALGEPELPIEKADQSALFQVINQLNPVVVVDESHHATSTLSHEMLVNFNPSFILDLTATPKKQSNIISYVDALSLKNANMVKLPVIAYNRKSQTEVITDAIDLRQSLEAAAMKQLEEGERYIRPIVLFQAQPKTGEDATSFERLRDKLVAAGIPENQIAIKTASINEIKNVDLLSPECEIRYIITVNALKEGWDCSFAYILASLANKTSQVDVEQILGRVLRQPHATRNKNQLLNLSYVLTSSNDFNATLSQIIKGLNNAGFSRKDFRAADDTQLALPSQPIGQSEHLPIPTHTEPEVEPTDQPVNDEFLDFDESKVAQDLNDRKAKTPDPATGITSMLNQAQTQGSQYAEDAHKAAQSGTFFVPPELETAVDTHSMVEEFEDEVSKLKIPQFFTQSPPSALFSLGEDGQDLLHHEALSTNFTLADKDIHLDLTAADEEMFKIDVSAQSDVPRAFRMSAADQRFMREHFSTLDPQAQKRSAARAIYDKLKPVNSVNDAHLRDYIERLVGNFSAEDMLTYQEHPTAVSDRIFAKIKGLLTAHKTQQFYERIETGRIGVQPSFTLPPVIQPIRSTSVIGGSLYTAEGSMNNDEMDMAARFSSMSNVSWWHRNLERKGLCINGPINHYPDFLVMTTSGVLVVVEPKGVQLKNDDSRQKVKLGRTWASMAGEKFRYYMVFDDGTTPLDGAVTRTEFYRILEQL